MTETCTLAPEPFDPVAELAALRISEGNVGAVASFTGVARGGTAGGTISGLFLEHHDRLTLRSMQDIAAAARTRFDVAELRIVHRRGMVYPGEPIVFVAATSAHRRAALDAVNYLMDRLKTDAMFWKREDLPDGSRWIEPTGADGAARAAWDDPAEKNAL